MPASHGNSASCASNELLYPQNNAAGVGQLLMQHGVPASPPNNHLLRLHASLTPPDGQPEGLHLPLLMEL